MIQYEICLKKVTVNYLFIINRKTPIKWSSPGQPGYQKAQPYWILMKQKMIGWQWYRLDHMQIICTSLQTDNHTSTLSFKFYKPDSLRDAQVHFPNIITGHFVHIYSLHATQNVM